MLLMPAGVLVYCGKHWHSIAGWISLCCLLGIFWRQHVVSSLEHVIISAGFSRLCPLLEQLTVHGSGKRTEFGCSNPTPSDLCIEHLETFLNVVGALSDMISEVIRG